MTQPSEDSSYILSSLPWAEILELSKSDHFAEKFNAIPDETLLFAMRESNRPFLIESALKSLKISDPDNANQEHAIKVADVMREFALRVLAERKKN